MDPKLKQKITLWSIGIFILGFIYFIIFMRKAFVRYEGEFPYIWTPGLNRSLRSYVNKFPSREILVITGAFKSGKTKAMKIVEKELQKSGRLVISLDPAVNTPLPTFIKSVNSAILRGLINCRPYLSNDIAKRLTERKAFREMKDIPVGLDQTLAHTYRGLSIAVKHILDNNGTVSAFSVSRFFDILDNYKLTLKPVIFVHNADALLDGEFKPLYDAVMARLSRRNQYNDYTPVVAEIHDTSVAYNLSFRDMTYIQTVATEELSQQAADILVKRKFFAMSEFRRAFSEFGGNPGLLVDLYGQLLFGTPLDDAVDAIEDDIERLGGSQDGDDTVTRALCRGKYVGAGDITEGPAREWLRRGLLVADANMTVAAGKAVMKFLCSK